MRTAWQTLQELRAHGYELSRQGGELRFALRTGHPAPSDRERLREFLRKHRDTLLTALDVEAKLKRGVPLPLGWTPEIEQRWGDITYTSRPTRAEYARRIGLLAPAGAKQEHLDVSAAIRDAFPEAKLKGIHLEGESDGDCRAQSPSILAPTHRRARKAAESPQVGIR